MRKVTIERSDTKETLDIQMRPLKKKEIKKLKDYGYSILGCMPTYAQSDDAVDKGLELVLDKDAMDFLDDCDPKEIKRVWSEMLKETYGDKDEVKNSKTTTAGTPTEKE